MSLLSTQGSDLSQITSSFSFFKVRLLEVDLGFTSGRLFGGDSSHALCESYRLPALAFKKLD